MTYKVELIRSDEGYAVACPELPGCWSQGATEKEALENIKDAFSLYLETQELPWSNSVNCFNFLTCP